MKVSSVLLSVAFLSSAIAAPQPSAGKDKVSKWDGKGKKWEKPSKDFTSTYSVVATPDQVVNATEDGEFFYTGGLPGAIGYYDFGIDSKTNTICYDITLIGFRGQYESAADTATHIHEAPKGETGPPRIAFPNPKPVGKGDKRVSKGCLKGPFETGVIDEDTGEDTGAGFTVSQIEENPAGFFCDVHSSLALPGAVRGQLG